MRLYTVVIENTDHSEPLTKLATTDWREALTCFKSEASWKSRHSVTLLAGELSGTAPAIALMTHIDGELI
jgi:hypothetical protein